MLKVLKIKVNGYKLLKENFEINLTTRTRVYEDDLEKEVMQVDEGLNSLRSIAFVGGNSSGKSTILSLIFKTLVFLKTGRWKYIPREFKNDNITLEVVFYLDKNLYKYSVVLNKIDSDNNPTIDKYSPIGNEKLLKIKYMNSRGKKNLDLLETDGEDITNSLGDSLNDTSAITKLTKNQLFVDEFNTNKITNFNEVIVRNTFFTSLNSCSKKLVSAIIQLFDDSIEYIIYNNSDYVTFKRVDEEEIIIHNSELISLLSAGTFRGVELYIRAFNALKNGAVFIVDEIENCFQKNLVNNLLFLFNDSNINYTNAQIIFSTHYVEILDYLKRRDGIFITNKNGNKINVKNLYSDYSVRTELLKSKQFDNNVFNTTLNYHQLLEVRRNLLNELRSNND